MHWWCRAVNGAGALLRTFSSDRKEAIQKRLTIWIKDEFFEHVVKKSSRQHRLTLYLESPESDGRYVTPLSGGSTPPDAFQRTLFARSRASRSS